MHRRPGTRGGVSFWREVEHLVRPTRLALVALLVAVAAGCGGGPTPIPSSPAAPPSAAPSTTPAPSASPSASPSATAGAVRLALDWSPNTDHTAFYVAKLNGWYDAAGVDLRILPYASTSPEALMTAGQAECGISFQDALTFAVAAGAPIVSVAAILQKTASAIAVLASSGIERPNQLDGRTYAGFGYPNEGPTLKAVIQADGGTGTFTTVTLDTAAYEALYAKRADFTIPFTAWEGVEAKERGIDLRYFEFRDYGFPDFYQVVLACDSRWLAREPDLARRFIGASMDGLELAATDPDRAARALVGENPGVFDANPDLPLESQLFLAEGGYLTDADGKVGTQTLQRWTDYSRFLYDQGLLTGPDGAPLATAPDYASLFTTDYLPTP